MLETAWEDDPPEGRPRRHLYRLTAAGAARVAELRAEQRKAGRPRPVRRAATEGT